MIKIKRVYEKAAKEDGERILVDRLWPRGLTKRKAGVDLWLKEIGPSTELRKWFGHDPERWSGFKTRYMRELKAKKELLDIVKNKSKRSTVTLLYGAKDTEHNEALVLKKYLDTRG
ncbi:MAG TPA: DUF488 domain-containing protein [Candidatus Paceibacterota bacterium]|nr:DUF488 domain-containing protein [Candidatus Paceibacterota bacterium]